MKKLSIASAILLSLVVFACNKKDKDDDTTTPEVIKKPSELIVGSWLYLTDSTITGYYGNDSTIVSHYGPQDSLIFKSNGTVISHMPSEPYSDTSTYKFLGDSTVVLWNDTVAIKKITDKDLTLFAKYTGNGPNGYYEEKAYISFKK